MTNRDFIESIAPYVMKYCKYYKVNYPSCVIAQACIESGYGNSQLSKKYNNYFGLKCGSNWVGDSVNLSTHEVIKGEYVKIRDDFRVFADMDSGIRGYFAFIKGYSRYKNLFTANNNIDYLEKIVADGYCTATNYVTTCLNVIKANNLERYDTLLHKNETDLKEEVTQRYIIGKTYKTNVNLYIRAGAGVSFSPIPHEKLTIDAKKHSIGSILNAGTYVTIKELKNDADGNVWAKIPSGYICCIYNNEVYVS